MEMNISDNSNINIKEIVIAVNNVLTEIYGDETRLSYLLSNIGFNDSQVEYLRKHHLYQIVQIYIESLQERILSFHDGERAYKIIIRYYGLDGKPRETLQTLGEQLSISRERVRQVKEKTLKKCKSKSSRHFLEAKLQEKAIYLLSSKLD